MPALICLLLFCALVTLGLWQVSRYQFKAGLMSDFKAKFQADPIPFKDVSALSDPNYTQVQVSGYFDNEHSMVLLNQTYQGRVGYDVLTPLQIVGSRQQLLVNRGWREQQSFQQVPSIPQATGRQNLKGYIVYPHHKRFILGDNIENTTQWPLKMQRISPKQLSELTKQAYYPYILRLAPKPGSGFIRQWPVSVTPPAKHLGYATQWFGMALALLIAFICLSTIKQQREVSYGNE